MSVSFSPIPSVPVGPDIIKSAPMDFLWSTMTTPTLYGWFHIMCLVMVVVLSAVIIARRRYITEKTVDRALMVFWITVCVFEVIKQINFSYSPASGEWHYQWYAFPFQFCSSILYVLPFALFSKNKRLRDFIYSFIATYNLFAGIAVMLYPADVFIGDIVINIQTMIHHGLMVVSAVLICATRRIELNIKTVFKGFAVFSALISVAMVLNRIFASKDSFNMFYIDVEGCHLPVLNMIWDNVPYAVFLLCYFFGFTLCALIVLLILKIPFIVSKNIKKRAKTY